ncbi:MAG: cyclic pyranopterin monophosphate synthase MoaC [Deltaproteobacteria bacterium]|nr:cyclic pyranopterin monophosphate synthase MoaC [Deltaproteobacteria bacterium]
MAREKKEKPADQLFSHLDQKGKAKMVDVGAKEVTERVALAKGEIYLGPKIMEALIAQNVKKGDVLGVARVSGIMAAKKTSSIIALCHNIPITGCEIDFDLDEKNNVVKASCLVGTNSYTGVEMEALTGVSVALLTVYDMCKSIDKGMVIRQVRLMKKTGGKSGTYVGDDGQKEFDL